MVKYIIFLEENEAYDLIDKINICKGWPSNGTITYLNAPDFMCEFDLSNGNKIEIGYGIEIKDFVMDCLNEEEISEIMILPSNINTCSWSVSGTT